MDKKKLVHMNSMSITKPMDMKHNIISNTLSKNIQPRGPLSKQVYLVATVKITERLCDFSG